MRGRKGAYLTGDEGDHVDSGAAAGRRPGARPRGGSPRPQGGGRTAGEEGDGGLLRRRLGRGGGAAAVAAALAVERNWATRAPTRGLLFGPATPRAMAWQAGLPRQLPAIPPSATSSLLLCHHAWRGSVRMTRRAWWRGQRG